MAEFDVLTREFVRTPTVFAEAFNGVFYGGKEVLKPSQLKEYDTTLLHSSEKVKTSGDVVLKDRDVIKIAYTDEHKIYLFLGIENQAGTDYDMPARVMIYDALAYDQQLKSKRAKIDHPPKRRLIPVITLVCYFGFSPWAGPKTLREMMGEYPEEIFKYVPDYPLNLLDPYSMSDNEISTFRGELGCVFECLRVHNNGEQLEKLINSDSRFSAISKTAAKLLNYRLQLNIDNDIESQKESVNMCKAMQEIIEKAQKDGFEKANKEIQQARDDAQQARDDAQQARDDAQQARDDAQQARNETQQARDDAQQARNIIALAVSNMMQMGQSQEAIAQVLGMSLQDVQTICTNS